MPRADIRMTDEETRAFLAEKHEVVVVANDAGGAPIATVAPYAFEDDVIVVSLATDDPVVAALNHDDRVCVVAEQFPSYFEVRSVVVHGRADLSAAVTEDGRRAMRVPLGDDTVTFDFAKMQPPAD